MSREPVLTLTKKDFKLEWFSGSGAGGQHRNKHQNCCRITHIKTGTVAQCTDHKERPNNQKVAFNRLIEKMQRWLEEETIRRSGSLLNFEATKTIKMTKKTIRTYHGPRNIVKDHASGHTDSYKEVVEKGNLGDMIDKRRETMIGKEFEDE